MAYGKKVDANQAEIVSLFRKLGAAVAITSSAGNGFPDLVVQRLRKRQYGTVVDTMLIEIKDGSLSPSRQALTPEQVKFHSVFRCFVVNCEADVYRMMDIHTDD